MTLHVDQVSVTGVSTFVLPVHPWYQNVFKRETVSLRLRKLRFATKTVKLM